MELWDLYDENRNLIGKTHIRGEALDKGLYHLVVEIWTIDKTGKILLTQRHPSKNHGLLWECTRGAVTAGENSLEGAVRELKEETGLLVKKENLSLIDTNFLGSSIMDTYVNILEFNLEDLSLQKIEVVDAMIVTINDFEKMYKQGLIVPSLWKRYSIYKNELLKFITNK